MTWAPVGRRARCENDWLGFRGKCKGIGSAPLKVSMIVPVFDSGVSLARPVVSIAAW